MASPRSSPTVVVLGAGAAGLCVSIKLLEAGIDDVTVLEKSDGVGGTWRANTYPGAACDVPSHLYSFSFAPKKDWTRKFAEQPEILSYFEDIADRYDLRRRIHFGTEVTGLRFDEATSQWAISLAGGGTMHAEVVISGLGQLNRPFVPPLAGLEDFGGAVFHSARWNHEVELAGKRIGVIGNGASAVQFVPPIAEVAERLTVFQRSANWIVPKPDREFSPRERFILERVPLAERLFRWNIYWRLEKNVFLLRRGSRLGQVLAKVISKSLRKLVSDTLPAEALIPDYPPGCKRILISNDYYRALTRPNVAVELSRIDHLEPGTVVTADGTRHRLDVLIFGTGFTSTDFLAPMRITGRGGVEINEEWSQGAKAHLGVMVSGFPNFFMLYGPNTNLGHNSIIFMIEAQARYITRAVSELRDDRLAWIDVRRDVMDRYNTQLQRNADGTVWVADCDSWYKNEHGVVTNNWPATTLSYWKRMRDFRSHEFIRRAAS